MNKIIALVEEMSAEQDKKFIDFLKSKGWGYWHWIEGSWLITADDWDKDVPPLIRDELQKIATGKHSMVFEVSGIGTWSGFGPSGDQHNMFKWIRDEWDTP
jgi:hypothetical protein